MIEELAIARRAARETASAALAAAGGGASAVGRASATAGHGGMGDYDEESGLGGECEQLGFFIFFASRGARRSHSPSAPTSPSSGKPLPFLDFRRGMGIRARNSTEIEPLG